MNSGIAPHQVCWRTNGVPMWWPKLEPGGRPSVRGLCVKVWKTRCVTPRASAWLPVRLSAASVSFHFKAIVVKASAAQRPLP